MTAILSSLKPINYFTTSNFHLHLPSKLHQLKLNKRGFQPPAAAAAPVSSVVPCPQGPQSINVEYFEKEFSNHGATFTELGESCVVRMELDNGSVAKLMLPSGLITSYKPKLWHGGKQEVLHTCVSEGGKGSAAVIQGGISLAMTSVDPYDEEGTGGFSWSPTDWSLNDVRGNSSDSIQVEIVSRESKRMVEVKYTITLEESSLISDIKVSNSKSSSIQLMVSVLSHLTVSTPDATYAIGLEGSNFLDGPPLLSDFSIIPPDPKRSQNLSTTISVDNLFRDAWGTTNIIRRDKSTSNRREEDAEIEKKIFLGEEKANYKHLTESMSRMYTNAPRKFTLIDRGKRNSLIIGKAGFEELYLSSPGSSHEWYGKYAYVTVGQSALLKPIILEPQDVWTGEQQLYNPNL